MKYFSFSIITMVLLMLASCSDGKHSDNKKWLHEDDVLIAVDETFAPILQEEIDAFGPSHVEATVIPTYCSEDSAIRLTVLDSVKCCVATRDFTQKEKSYIIAKKRSVRSSIIATDAIALVVNKQNPDSVISVEELRDIVSGKITRWEQLAYQKRSGELQLLFDNNGSSTVRYMQDSLLNGGKLQGNVFAAGSNTEVIERVRKDPDVIGVVGVDWIKEHGAEALFSFTGLDFTVMHVSVKKGDFSNSFWPFQYYIARGDYPLIRSVYVLTTDTRSRSQNMNFYFFLKGDAGQRVICNNSQLLPYSQVQVRSANVH